MTGIVGDVTDYLFGLQQYVQLGMNKSSNQPLISGVHQVSMHNGTSAIYGIL